MQVPLLDRCGAPAKFGTVRLHRGDWRVAWWGWPVGVVITDPPYGIKYESNYHRGFHKGTVGQRELAKSVVGDESTDERDAVMATAWVAAAVWGPRRLDLVRPWGKPRDILCHDKGGIGMGDLSLPWKPSWETIAIYGDGWTGKRTDGVLRGSVVGFGASSASNGRKHPNQKPLQVCAELVSKAPLGLDIIDPFAGSGQILLAAALLGRDAYGAEIDGEHYATCKNMLQANGVKVVTS